MGMTLKISAGKHGEFDMDVPESHAVEQLRELWEEYVLHRQQIRKPMSIPCAKRRFRQILALPLRDAIRWLDYNMEMNYEGFFEPKPDWSAPGDDQSRPAVKWGVH